MNSFSRINIAIVAVALFSISNTYAMHHGHSKMSVMGSDQDVSGGTVIADKIVSPANGWLVVHRTDDTMKPGPVIAHAPLKKGENTDVAAILTERVMKGEKLMLMLHGETGGMKTGIFEYTLGAKEDGPIKMDGKLVMDSVTAN